VESFHGYAAPGLIMGGFMVDIALSMMPEGVLFEAVSKTRNCLPDAIQLLTPCTIGNGWMRILNLGRYALSLYDKKKDFYSTMAKNIRFAAENYLEKGSIVTRIYNKIKHVFPVVSGAGWLKDSPREEDVAVVVEDHKGEDIVGIVKLPPEHLNIYLRNIDRLTLMGVELLALLIVIYKLEKGIRLDSLLTVIDQK